MGRLCYEASLLSKTGNDEKEVKAILDEYQVISKSNRYNKGIEFDAFIF